MYVYLLVCGYCQASGSPASARRLGIASVVFSVLGILVTVVAAVVVLLVYGAAIIPEITYQFKVTRSVPNSNRLL